MRTTDRREGRPGASAHRTEVPLARLSRTHFAVRVEGSLEGDAGVRIAHEAVAILDTGLSLPITTPDGQRRFGLSPGAGESVKASGISGVTAELFPADESNILHLALVPRGDPARVETTVRYLGVDRLLGADVILPPQFLGPTGGAVRLDFGGARFVSCETVRACLDGPGWVRLSGAPCAARPELVVVGATVAGRPARLLLDTGSATLVSRRFYDDGALARAAHLSQPSELIGSGGASTPGRLVAGEWPLTVGEGRLAAVTARTLWVLDEPGGPTAECQLDGALGADALAECTLVVADGVPLTAFVRCPDPPRSRPG